MSDSLSTSFDSPMMTAKSSEDRDAPSSCSPLVTTAIGAPVFTVEDFSSIFNSVTSELEKANLAIKYTEESFKELEVMKMGFTKELECTKGMVQDCESYLLYLTEKSGLMEECLLNGPPQNSIVMPKELQQPFKDVMKQLADLIQTSSTTKIIPQVPRDLDELRQAVRYFHHRIICDRESLEMRKCQLDAALYAIEEEVSVPYQMKGKSL